MRIQKSTREKQKKKTISEHPHSGATMKQELLFTTATTMAVFSIFIFFSSGRRGADTNLRGFQLISLAGADGPESLAFDADGRGPYVSVYDGRILRWRGEELGWDQFALTRPHREEYCRRSPWSRGAALMEDICGRPLGLRFNQKTGDLYIADAYLGLLLLPPQGGTARPVVTEAQGIPFKFTNNMDVEDQTGIIYFTDSSSHYFRRQFLSAIISGDSTGRVVKYDPRTNQTTVLITQMAIPNGVALSKDGSFLLVAETSKCRIIKLWLKSNKAGSSEVLMDVPGFPDNIRRNPDGDFWVAIFSKRGRLLNWLLSYPPLGRLFLKLFPFNVERWYWNAVRWVGSNSFALKINEEGKILDRLGDGGKKLRFITEVEEMHGSLWVGSLMMPYVAICRL